MDTYVEPTFGQDSFRKPKVLKGWEAVAQSAIIVLFGKPGFYPSIPELGMNIQQYRYANLDELDTEAIQEELAYQCAGIRDDILSGDIQVTKTVNNGKPALLILLPFEDNAKQDKVLIGVQLGNDNISYHYELMDAAMLN